MCELVTKAGADFIKTSTGFSKAGATFADIELLQSTWAKRQNESCGRYILNRGRRKFVELGASRLGTSRIVKIVKSKKAKANIDIVRAHI